MLGLFSEYERAKIMERMTRGRLYRQEDRDCTGHARHQPRNRRLLSEKSLRCSQAATTDLLTFRAFRPISKNPLSADHFVAFTVLLRGMSHAVVVSKSRTF